MYIAPKTISAPKAPQMQFWPKEPMLLNGGLNLVDKEWKISDNQTSKVLNMWFYQGELSKRWGQDFVNNDLGTVIYNAYKYKYDGKIVFQSGTKLYTLADNGTTTEIFSGLTASKGSFFKFNNKLYFRQAGKYVQWDGITASAVTPYIPTVIINRTPTGGGNTNEQYNRIGAGFKNSFNGNGSATAYTLTDTNLDGTAVTATVGGVAKVEGVDFTVNRITGVVTFTVAPANGTNNVIITAYKTNQADIDSVLNCKYAVSFGGQNDNRMFFAGNGTGYFYWTGITTAGVDATYVPYNNYNIIGNSDEDITGFGKHYDTLIMHKKSGEIFGETYSWNGTTGVFNTFPINSQYGCDCPDTIQNINNNLVWLNSKYGVCTLLGTTVGSQRNAFPISRNINPRLLSENNLTEATSVDFNGKYWLCVGDKVYLWDYFISPYVVTGNPDEDAKRLSWWYFDNISAGSWVTDGQDLYYGHRTLGRFVKFHTVYDSSQWYDFGNGFNTAYRLPLRDLGGGIVDFDVTDLWVDVRGDTRTDIDITYFTSDEINGVAESEPITVGSFSLLNFSLLNYTLQVMGFKTTFHLEPLEKKIDLFGVEFSNNSGGRDMNISNVAIGYITRKMKK